MIANMMQLVSNLKCVLDLTIDYRLVSRYSSSR